MQNELSSHSPGIAARRAALATLAYAKRSELAEPLAQFWPNLPTRTLRKPEIGLVMVRGRMGGDGAPFNLGETTVSRAVIALETGEHGYGQVLGRDAEHARLAAILDALWQRADARERVEATVLTPIRTRLAAETQRKQAETAATKVEFFTLVRGED